MCKLVKLFYSKDWQEPGCKQILTQNSLVKSTQQRILNSKILTQNSLVKSTQQRILNSRKFELSSYTVAVQLPPQQQSRQDHSFYVVHYIALCGQFLLEQDSLVLIVTSPEEITYLLATFA